MSPVNCSNSNNLSNPMKTRYFHPSIFLAAALCGPVAADTIYSNYQNITIPTDFTGVTVSVAGGTLNPFFGGVGVANNDLLQPIRTSTSNLGTLRDFTVGTTIDASQLYLSTGFGGSSTHLGATFTAGTEGYIGFKLNDANYGWMRVVFTSNTGGAVIKDWAYDNRGAAIVTGRVEQSAPVTSAQLVTLSPTSGESFTLGSQITNTGGNTNSVVKTGNGSTTLTGTNNYSGTTTIHAGTLILDGSGSIANSSSIIVGEVRSSTAVLDVSGMTGGFPVGATQTLGGAGSITGSVTVNGGILAPGNSIESLAVTGDLTLNTGSSFAYEMNSGAAAAAAADFQKVSGALSLSGSVNLALADLAGSPVAFAPATTLSLINYAGAWNGGFFTCDSLSLANGATFTAGLNTWRINYDATSGGLNFATEYSGGHFVTLTAIPEPGSWLALACLLGTGTLLRRSRSRISY